MNLQLNERVFLMLQVRGDSLKKADILPEENMELNLKVIATNCSTRIRRELFRGILLFRLII